MKKYLPIPIIIAVTFVVYFGALSSGFFRDDFPQITENKWLTSASYIPVIFTSPPWGYYEGDFVQGASNYYRPMLHLVNMAIYAFAEKEPFGYHLVNVFLHILNAVMVFLSASVVLGSYSGRSEYGAGADRGAFPIFPLAAGLMFALNPVNVEAVTWVAAVMELFFTFLSLLSFYLYARASRARTGVTLLYAFSVFFYAVGLLSKETAIFLPFLIVVYDYAQERLSLKSVVRYMPYAIATGAFLLVRSRISGPLNVEHDMSPFQYVLSVAAIAGKYIGKLVFPFDLKLYYAFRPTESISGLFNHEVLLALLLASLVLYSLVRFRDRRIALCVFWILVPLSPAILLIKYIQGEWVFASRYLYMPSAWFAILIALLLREFFGAGRASRGPSGSLMKAVPVVIVLPLLVFYSVDTVAAIKTWKDELSYWKKAVEDAPKSATAHGSLGVAYAEAGRYAEAVKEYERALALAPDSGGLYMNIGVIYYNLREFDSALPMLRKALELTKNESVRTNLLFSLGKVYYQKGMFAEAAESLEAAAARGSSDDL
ncbi:MAG: tetratricopeptide repeat protein, partial [Deltaproteobacteria bacterium]|nr:tetratricopeptide repeat protein [Deltaproteobacteria bacterium]